MDEQSTATILRLLVVGIIELLTVFFASVYGETDTTLLSSCLALSLVIWSDKRHECGLSGTVIFLLVVFFHLYTLAQYVYYNGSITGQFLLFGIGMSLSSSFGC